MPKVSVIIPTHNRSGCLKLAIASVLNQTYQDFEIIVVDDASNDNTVEIVETFNEERIKYIRHEKCKGPAGARNTGVKNASGKYVAFLDDDDEWLPQKLFLQVDVLDHSSRQIAGVYSGFLRIDKRSRKTIDRVIPTKRGDIFQDMLLGNCIGTSTILLKKECFERVGLFDESMLFCEDYDLWVRISKQFQFEYIKEPLVNYSVQENSYSTNYERVIMGIETLNRKYENLFAINRKNYSNRCYTLGVLYCYSGRIKEGREAFLTAIKLYPFDIRHYYNLCLSLLGTDWFKKLKRFRDLFAGA